jgi:formylglycine-generating enzyme required for sulfatase activity
MAFVRLDRGFWMGAHEVTQAEWQDVMGANPSHFHGDRLPVEGVSWFDVETFLERMTSRNPGNRFRLPTEAEWEYACRAGTATTYNVGDTLTTAQANIARDMADTAAGQGATRPVGSYPPNAWGLYDMHGNVWEWTADATGDLKIIRGGSWYFDAASAPCGLRYTHRPQDTGFSLGFRVVREAPGGAPPAP